MRILTERPVIQKHHSAIMVSLFIVLAIGTLPFGVIAQSGPGDSFENDFSFTYPAPHPAPKVLLKPEIRVKTVETNQNFDMDFDFSI